MANNSLTPTRPTFPRPSNTDERKSKLQQRLTLNHINPALSTSSVISLGLHGSHHKSKGFLHGSFDVFPTFKHYKI